MAVLLMDVRICYSSMLSLRPLKIPGSYQVATGSVFPSYFLSPEAVEIIEDSDTDQNSVRVCDLIPLPISSTHYRECGFSSGSQICNRDKGLYDRLPYHWGASSSKRTLFDFLCYEAFRQIPSVFKTPSHALLDAARRLLGVEAKALFVEIVDEKVDQSVQLGACLLLSRVEHIPGSKESQESAHEECYVYLHTDELVHMSVDLDVPILMDKQLFQKCCIDATLFNNVATSDDSSDDGAGDVVDWSQGSRSGLFIRAQSSFLGVRSQSALKQSATQSSPARPVWEIYDSSEFLRMSVATKRELLRQSGITSLPRPREGVAALDALLTENMDAAVRAEYLRQLASGKSKPKTPASTEQVSTSNTGTAVSSGSGFSIGSESGDIVSKSSVDSNSIQTESALASNRQLLLQQMAESLSRGDIATATRLRDEFALLTALRADPTQEKGSYDPFLDQDDWYMRARRKAMAPKKPSSGG